MPEWFKQLTEDSGDPHTPAFWETLAWASKQGMDLKPPEVTLPPPSLGVQIAELKRQVAIKTPTQMMPTLEVSSGNDGDGDGSPEPGPASTEQPV